MPPPVSTTTTVAARLKIGDFSPPLRFEREPHIRPNVTSTSRRKEDHLDLAIQGNVGFRDKSTLFETVQFVHNALPELDLREIDLRVQLLGRTLRAPIVLAGMTGGTPRAEEINHQLASIAEERGYGFGLGSQRAMLEDPQKRSSYAVRRTAPSSLILGNIVGVQAAQISPAAVAQLVADIQADALCVHLNPAMEVVQGEGDRDFRGVEATIARLVSELNVPIIVKETGCGLSHQVANRLLALGVQHLDLSGSGGTSWVGVEASRASAHNRSLGEAFWDWGIPTAASLLQVIPARFQTVIATGGISGGEDAARAIALGAHAVGIARPVLQALDNGGRQGALDYLTRVERELKTTALLVGARNLRQLQAVPTIVGSELEKWRPPSY